MVCRCGSSILLSTREKACKRTPRPGLSHPLNISFISSVILKAEETFQGVVMERFKFRGYLLLILLPMILGEYFWIHFILKKPYPWRDGIVSIVLSFQVFGVLMFPVISGLSEFLLAPHWLLNIPLSSVPAAVGLFFLYEFIYYWEHRLSHHIRWLWASTQCPPFDERINGDFSTASGMDERTLWPLAFFTSFLFGSDSIHGRWPSLSPSICFTRPGCTPISFQSWVGSRGFSTLRRTIESTTRSTNLT